VQRSAASVIIGIFYFCSFMAAALSHPEWTPGNFIVQLSASLGPGFFQGLRAILCLATFAACVLTFIKNATSRINRNVRFSLSIVGIIAWISFDYFQTRQQRTIHSNYLKSPASAKFMIILPGMTSNDATQVLNSEQLSPMKQQMTEFEIVQPSTQSLLGQLVTTFLGTDPQSHGIRHDFIGQQLMTNVWTIFAQQMKNHKTKLNVTSIGGPSPLESLVSPETQGERCGQEPKALSRLARFQASVFPYALTPRILESYLIPELDCSGRFLTLSQHLIRAYEKITSKMHEGDSQLFILWFSPQLRTVSIRNSEHPDEFDTWSASAKYTHEILSFHTEFLRSARLDKSHETYIIGLSQQPDALTAFIKWTGQADSNKNTEINDKKEQMSQKSLARFLHPQQITPLHSQQIQEQSTPQHINLNYSEFTDEKSFQMFATLKPDVKFSKPDATASSSFVLDSNTLRRAIVYSKRHVFCQNVVDEQGKALRIKVSLILRNEEDRIPKLTYEEFERSPIEPAEATIDLQNCLKSAHTILSDSVFRDISMRDSSAFRTLLVGLPVKSIKLTPSADESANETDDENAAFDETTSSIPTSPSEEQDE
jgi:hypothetical protein